MQQVEEERQVIAIHLKAWFSMTWNALEKLSMEIKAD